MHDPPDHMLLCYIRLYMQLHNEGSFSWQGSVLPHYLGHVTPKSSLVSYLGTYSTTRI